jgi:hypothetical protein
MGKFSAPTTHNELDPADSGNPRRAAVSLYVDPITGRVRMYAGALPAGHGVQAWFDNDAATGRVVMSTHPANVRLAFCIGDNFVLL